VYVNAELIAIVASAIALGTAMIASIRGVRQEVRDLRNEMKGDMNALRSEMKGDVKALGNELRREMKATENTLRDAMQAGFKELTARVVNIGDRLSKVEGIIEGMFWGARNQQTEKPGEGAA
jgi:Sec-independent protein translocase protein TatA